MTKYLQKSFSVGGSSSNAYRDNYEKIFPKTGKGAQVVTTPDPIEPLPDPLERRPNPLHSSVSNEWYTPSVIVEAARSAMGSIDLDPASCEEANRIVQATQFFHQDEDGLERKWEGNVFLNPPGGKTEGKSNAALWWKKLSKEFHAQHTRQAVFIGFSLEILQTHQNVVDALNMLRFPLCVPKRRIAFLGNGSQSPTHGNVIVGVGIEPGVFRAAFFHIGACT